MRQIEDLREAVESRRVTSADIRAHRRYIDAIQTLDEFDSYTQFELKADQDGVATLVFNTPEAQLRDTLKQMSGYLSGAIGDTLSKADATLESTVKLKKRFEDAKAVIEEFEHGEKAARKLKASIALREREREKEKQDALGLGPKLEGTIDRVYREYKTLLDLRIQAREKMERMANLSMCRVVYGAPLSLAKLYHFTLPMNSSCNPGEVRALQDRIKRITGATHGILYDVETYRKLRRVCSIRWDRIEKNKKRVPTTTPPQRGSAQGGAGFMSELEELDQETTDRLNETGPRRRSR